LRHTSRAGEAEIWELSMNLRRWPFPFAAVASAALAYGAPALAQPNVPPSSPQPGYSGAPAQPTPADQSDRLRQGLRLRPDQEGALQAFVAAMRPAPGETERLRDQAKLEGSLPTPQRLDAMVARMDRMRATVMTRVRATKTFYSQLTPEQQRSFDTLPPPQR
jgi:periplasmic protein CpxP/Spy